MISLKTLCATLLVGFSTFAHAEWNLEKPAADLSKPLTGEIYGRAFKLGEAKLSSQNILTIASKDKLGGWAESELVIFLPEDQKGDQKKWSITADDSGFGNPQVHMVFMKKGNQLPSTLMFGNELLLSLELMEKTDTTAKFQIHVSLPDYKKSFLLGAFEAKVVK
jgi:hypothetical protein